jgi:superfamily I DNA and/or RNA helicase
VVFASTVQQSEGKDIRKAKIVKRNIEATDLIEYDVVLVDEAARVSPRDLLIPMAQGKKVILVGDHRQLPHLLNEAVVKRLESTNEEDKDGDVPEIDYVKHSMFRYLFNRLKKIEEADNIPRTVTLDAQFRMHPLLGNFVSEQFYSKKERFSSPLKSEEFEHSLSNCENQCAVWLDVPSMKGKESQTSKKSRFRKAEAKSIAKQLNDWIKSEAGKKLTFGVISFYKAQVYKVYSELEKYGITHRDSDGNWQINDEYRKLEGDLEEEKLRIGTVDSFQGMEFDVVFLSIVRSQNEQIINNRLEKSEDERWAAMGLFGHLISENRLCVSMSRQKKVLVAVGDANMFQMEIAEQNVPALYNYYILSKDEGVVFQ